MISIIACMDMNNGIGIDNKLPWNIKGDMQHFVEMTTNKIVVMGRKTFESIGKPLHNRTNVLLSSDKELHKNPNIIVFDDIEPVLSMNRNFPEREIVVIGGSNVYRQFLPHADKLYLTVIQKTYECDSHFPDIGTGWVLSKFPQKQQEGELEYWFVEFERSLTSVR